MKKWAFSTVIVFVLLACELAAEMILPLTTSRGTPTPEQIAWHEMELSMFIHFSPATWQGREYDDRSTPLDKMTLESLDTDQWCQAAHAFGAKQIVFVAKHVGGFCWWQTETSEYGIRNTPYKDGKGDILADIAASCKKYGLKLGVYIYPGDVDYGAGIGSGGRTADPTRQSEYNKVFRQQLTEVLSRYGEMNEVWFDGSLIIEIGDILKRHASKAMVFQGKYATIRWPGNEVGHSPYPAWQTVKKAHAVSGVSTGQHGDPMGDVWLPMEMDTTLLGNAWFWKPDWENRIKTVEQLMDTYYRSVGRGGVLLLNATPDTTGLIPESHMKRYREFGEAIQGVYANEKGRTSGRGKELKMMFEKPTIINHVITMEDIKYGHIIHAYEVDGLVGDKWQKLHDGISVGYKQIDVIEPVEVKGVKLRITKCLHEPQIKSFAVYEVKSYKRSHPDSADTDWQKVATLSLTDKWQVIDVDLTEQICDVGQYEVQIRPVEDVELNRVVVVMSMTEAPRLITQLDRPLSWNINRTAVVTPDENGRTILRLEARGTKAVVYIRAGKKD